MADLNINHQDAINYWQGIDADVNGMLGGFPYISKVDLQGSKNFLAKLGIGGKNGRIVERAVDCGAGIGRITEGLLVHIATTVDIVEPISKFSALLSGKPGVGNIFNIGLEDWDPSSCSLASSSSPSDNTKVKESVRYDIIWNQWCVGHLTDSQLVTYLERCGKGIRDGGFVIVKENLATGGEDVFDELDSSVTRTDEKFRLLFQTANMHVKRSEIQRGLPDSLFPVRTYALQPISKA